MDSIDDVQITRHHVPYRNRSEQTFDLLLYTILNDIRWNLRTISTFSWSLGPTTLERMQRWIK